MRRHFIKLIFGFIWLVLFYLLLFDAEIRFMMLSYCEQHPILAPFLLILTQLCLSTFALPCSLLTVLAGMLWGFHMGIIYATGSTMLSSLWTFLVGRFVLKKRFKNTARFSWWPKIVDLVSRYQWKASMIAHANPVFPGSSLGYVFGMSEVTLRAFLLGALLGNLPLQLVMVGAGGITGKFVADNLGFFAMIFILVFFVCFVSYKLIVSRLLERA